ncbi:MAG TPA: 2-amino-4-hydroxy-6-hydroxymethyldihydropteridine diphosphokinase [Elusimicrobiota bacterium]|nr:2-amino-4-hydroxy-6-hydroxymethyldihydropteridine diphosphokinase [Elusimicrobiota bacterium]
MSRPRRRRARSWLLLLGSNQGRRDEHLRLALEGLSEIAGARLRACSQVYETGPVGPPQRRFLNMAVRLSVPLSPLGLLIEAKRLEARAGRRPGPRWGPRPLDIDLIACRGTRLRAPWLRLPHPRAAQRRFVLEPLAEIAPRWRLGGRSVLSLLRRLKRGGGSVKILPAREGRIRA